MKALFVMSLVVLLFNLVFASCQSKKQNDEKVAVMTQNPKYQNEIKSLITELDRKGIKDKRVIAAIETVPRHAFVSERLKSRAYENSPLPIDKDQTISQPYTVAFQTELLKLQNGDKVLEIGTGSGYQAAILCEMGMDVYSIERHLLLHDKAKLLLDSLGYKAHLFYGDGYRGLPDQAPFDKILITAAIGEVPSQLLEQMKIGGLLVAPIGDDYSQEMTVIERLAADEFRRTKHGTFVFVPMIKGLGE